MKLYKFEILNANHLCKRKTKKPLSEIIRDLRENNVKMYFESHYKTKLNINPKELWEELIPMGKENKS